MKSEIEIQLSNVILAANLSQPENAKAVVIFAHGSGSSRVSTRNNFVAELLNKRGATTLLADLLTPAEDELDDNRFNIDLITGRLIRLTEWALEQLSFHQLPIGYFGASTGAASALQAAAFLIHSSKPLFAVAGARIWQRICKK